MFNRTEYSVDKLTAENFPELFEDEEMIPIWLRGGWGALPLTSRDLGNSLLMGRFETVPQKVLVAAISACLPQDLPSGEICASKEESDSYFSEISVTVTYLHNYIDYEIVKDEPIDKVLKIYEQYDIDPSRPKNLIIALTETRVELMDKLWQVFTKAEEFFFLNLSPSSNYINNEFVH